MLNTFFILSFISGMPNKLTTEQFIEKAREVHGDKFDYSMVEYLEMRNKIKVICTQHGEFEQRAFAHLKGQGCRKCYAERKTTTKEEFIEKAKKVHGYKYDYSLAEYINSSTKVKIICSEHGEFEQAPYSHLQGRGCLKCSIKKQAFTTEQFIEKAREVHGDKYDYSLVEYINFGTKVKIICPQHGEFEQSTYSHLQGRECLKCSTKKQTFTTEQFIEKAREVHGDKYDYSLVDYVQIFSKVKIICPEHGEFEQVPNSHLQGRGCNDCAQYSIWYNRAKRSKSFDSFKAYFVKCHDNNQAFYKIGVTYNELKLRLKHIPYKYEIINVKEIKDINDKEGARMIFGLESRFKKMYKNKKYTPKKEFHGMNECFSDKIK